MEQVKYCDHELSQKLKRLYEQASHQSIKASTWRKILCLFRKQTEHKVNSDEFAQKVWFEGKRIFISRKLGKRFPLNNDLMEQVKAGISKITEERLTAKEFTFLLCDRLNIEPATSTKYWFFQKMGAGTVLDDENRFVVATRVLIWKLEKEKGEGSVKLAEKKIKAAVN